MRNQKNVPYLPYLKIYCGLKITSISALNCQSIKPVAIQNWPFQNAKQSADSLVLAYHSCI